MMMMIYVVHSISFQTFCTGIYNCRRLLRILYVIAIDLMRWLTNFYDFRFKWTATAGIQITLLKPDCHSWWISKMQSGCEDTLEEQYAIKLCFKLGKMPLKLMECFGLLLEHLAWIEHQFLSGIRDSRKAGSLWGMTWGVGGVRKSIHQSWLAKGLSLRLLCWVLREFRKRFLGKRPALFKSGQWHFHRNNTPVHNSILVTDYLTKMGIKTVPHPLYSRDLAPCDLCLFPKLRSCRYERIEEMKEAVTKVIDMLTQEVFHRAFQEM